MLIHTNFLKMILINFVRYYEKVIYLHEDIDDLSIWIYGNFNETSLPKKKNYDCLKRGRYYQCILQPSK